MTGPLEKVTLLIIRPTTLSPIIPPQDRWLEMLPPPPLTYRLTVQEVAEVPGRKGQARYTWGKQYFGRKDFLNG